MPNAAYVRRYWWVFALLALDALLVIVAVAVAKP